MKFGTATLVKDIIYFEGPLLSLYKQEDKLFLVLWTDVIETEHHWNVIETDDATMQEYYAKKITLLDMMRKSPVIYKGVNSFIGNNAECELVKFEDLEESSLPTTKSYFDESLTNED
jgi:hypothetical protein